MPTRHQSGGGHITKDATDAGCRCSFLELLDLLVKEMYAGEELELKL